MKNKLLYSLIGIFLGGGVILSSLNYVYADFPSPNIQVYPNFLATSSYPNGYTTDWFSSPSKSLVDSLTWASTWLGPFQNNGTCTGSYPSSGNSYSYVASTTDPNTCFLVIANGQNGGFDTGGNNAMGQDQLVFNNSSAVGNYFYIALATNGNYYYATAYWNGSSPVFSDGSNLTHFISLSPTNSSTVSTTTSVGALLYANASDFPNYGRLHVHFTQDSAFACQNSGAVYDAIATCAGSNVPASPIDIDFSTSTLGQLLSGNYNQSQLVTFGGGGNWTGVYTIDQVSSPWYLFGLSHSYNTLVSTTTHFTVGYPSPMDLARAAVMAAQSTIASTTAHGVAAILASTTASWDGACKPFSLSFSISDCLTLTIWPGTAAINDDLTIIKQTPPWGYVFRTIDILNEPFSTTTLPTIDYTFATGTPLAVIGDIHFDPFGEIEQSGTLINEMRSDRQDGASVWTILMPIVNIVVYLTLGFMIIHDLSDIHKHANDNNKKE